MNVGVRVCVAGAAELAVVTCVGVRVCVADTTELVA